MTQPRVIHYAARSQKEAGSAFPSTEAQLIRMRQDSQLRRQTVVAEFEEVDHSGAYLRGPKLREAMAMLERGDADVLKVVRWNRIARNLYKRFQFLEKLTGWGTTVEAIEDKLDFASAKGRLIASVLGAIDQYHSEEASELMALKVKQRVLDKQLHTGSVPFGYRMKMIPDPADPDRTISSGELIVEPDEAEQLRLLKGWLLESGSLTYTLDMAATKKLTRPRKHRGVAGPALWTRGSLEYVLLNEIYTGRLRYKGKLYPGKHQPLWTADEHEQLTAVIAACKGATGKGDRRNVYSYLLSGRIWFASDSADGPQFDPYFGYTATKKRPDGSSYYYYRRASSSRRHYSGSARQSGTKVPFSQIRTEDIETYVIQQLREFALNETAWGAMHTRVSTACAQSLELVEARLAQVEADLDAAKAERGKLRAMLLKMSDDALQAEVSAMLNQLNERESQAEQLKLDGLTLRDWYLRAPQELSLSRGRYLDLLKAWDKGQRRVAQGLFRDLLAEPFGVVIRTDRIELNIRAGAAIEKMSNRCGNIETDWGIPMISTHLFVLFQPLVRQRAA